MAAPQRFTTSEPQTSHYEQDPRHRVVDAYTTHHLLSPTRNPHLPSLEKIYHDSISAGLPDIACSPSQAKFLMLQIQSTNSKNILEVGTLGGYSAAWMATASPDVKITTIELDERNASIAAANIATAGFYSQIEILTGPGLDILPKLLSQVQSNQRPIFDFTFIDANKEDNLEYFNLAVQMTRPKGTIIVDNVVRNGKIVSEEEAGRDERVRGTRRLIEEVGRDERVEATIIQTVGEKNYDGFLIAVKV